MASKVGLSSPKEAERQLVTMIEEGSIFARISQKDGNHLVSFDLLFVMLFQEYLKKTIAVEFS